MRRLEAERIEFVAPETRRTSRTRWPNLFRLARRADAPRPSPHGERGKNLSLRRARPRLPKNQGR